MLSEGGGGLCSTILILLSQCVVPNARRLQGVITNSEPQAIHLFPREAWQKSAAIHASSETGSGSTSEIQ